jgi:hypothetical protein
MNSYGYSEQAIRNLLGKRIAPRINTGICGLDGNNVDWEQIEYWCKHLLIQEGLNHFLEQTLTAMWLTDNACVVAPSEDYIVYPKGQEARRPTAVMHHYVDTSREEYYRWGWRTVRALAQA